MNGYGALMLIRRCLILVFVLTQVSVSLAMPVAGSVPGGHPSAPIQHAAHAGDAGQAEVALDGHCGGEAQAADSGHDNCADECRLCAACAVAVALPLTSVHVVPDSVAVVPLAGAAPPGISHLPYRPPPHS